MKRVRLPQVRQIFRPTDAEGKDAEGKPPAEDAPSNPAVVSVDKEAEAKAKVEAVRKERREGVRTGMKGPNPQLPAFAQVGPPPPSLLLPLPMSLLYTPSVAFEQVGARAPRPPCIADPLASHR